jgi:hypothetical protein
MLEEERGVITGDQSHVTRKLDTILEQLKSVPLSYENGNTIERFRLYLAPSDFLARFCMPRFAPLHCKHASTPAAQHTNACSHD